MAEGAPFVNSRAFRFYLSSFPSFPCVAAGGFPYVRWVFWKHVQSVWAIGANVIAAQSEIWYTTDHSWMDIREN